LGYQEDFTALLIVVPRAARRAGLEFVEKLLTKLTSTDTTERNAGSAGD
jgi:hypothetical protein